MQNLSSPSPLLAPVDAGLQSEIEQLGQKLASRDSVVHLARGFILCCLSVISLGVASRLVAESSRLPHFFWPIAVAGLLSLSWSLMSLRSGQRLLAGERADFGRYLELRHKAGFDT